MRAPNAPSVMLLTIRPDLAQLQTVVQQGIPRVESEGNSMVINPEPFSLSVLKVSYQLWNEPHRILLIAFHGEYRPGSAGNDDAYFMYGLATAGVEARRPAGIILDFRDLKYVWGDMLELVYNAAPSHAGDHQTFAVVVGETSKEALRTLELGQFSQEPSTTIPWMHESLDAAYAYLAKALTEASA